MLYTVSEISNLLGIPDRTLRDWLAFYGALDRCSRCAAKTADPMTWGGCMWGQYTRSARNSSRTGAFPATASAANVRSCWINCPSIFTSRGHSAGASLSMEWGLGAHRPEGGVPRSSREPGVKTTCATEDSLLEEPY